MAEKTIRVMGKDLPVNDLGVSGKTGRFMGREVQLEPDLREYFNDVLFGGEGKYADKFKEAALGKYAKGMKKGGAVKSASARGDGCAQRGKTKGRMV
jgi:hypothetical protein